eukprot:TRINITY_DN8034_c0_g1_i9.p1 TRINITY_DN8034_c0_g1~~TRINITY_DN8034_c0_g1_i9.p1  ORF type:complete len:729 (-),score=232.18 TRINITY_DN8034_c0_g1_i9:149-2335(-)
MEERQRIKKLEDRADRAESFEKIANELKSEKEKINKKFQEVVGELEERKGKCSELEEDLREVKEDYAMKAEEVNKFGNYLQELQNKHMANLEHCKELEKNLEKLRSEYDSKKVLYEACESQAKESQQMLEKYKELKESYMKLNSDYDLKVEQCNELDMKIKELIGGYDEKSDAYDQLEIKMKELENNYTAKAGKCNELESKVKELTVFNDSKEFECAELKTRIEQLETTSDLKIKECVEIDNKLKKVASECERISQEKAELGESLKELESSYSTKIQECKELNERISTLESDINSQHKVIDEKDEEITELKIKMHLSENKTKEDEAIISELRNKLDKAQGKVSELTETINGLNFIEEAKSKGLNPKVVRLERDIMLLKNANNELKDHSHSLEQELAEYQSILDAKTEGIRELQNDLALKVSEIEELKHPRIQKAQSAKDCHLPESMDQLRERIKNLEVVGKRKDAAAKKCEEESVKVQREMIVVKAKLESTEKKLAAKIREILKLKAENSMLSNLPTSFKPEASANKEVQEQEESRISISSEYSGTKSTSQPEFFATEEVKALKKKYEFIAKENSELKSALLHCDNANLNTRESNDANTAEELKTALKELISVYETMRNKAKEGIMRIDGKKVRVNELMKLKERLAKSRKQGEAEAILKELERKVMFLKGIGNKANYMKIIPNCLTEVATKKLEKIMIYDQEIEKLKSAIEEAGDKIREYEHSLELYS